MSKGPCDRCGSSDARKTFENGSWFCYSCRESEGELPGGDPAKAPKRRSKAKPAGGLIAVTPRDLVKRGLRLNTCEKWGYGVGTHRGQTVQVAQYRNKDGEVVGQKIRTANKEFEILGSIKECGLFGQWLWRDGGKMIVVTEGEIDAMTVSQLQDNKWPVVSLPNGAQSGAKAVAQSVEFLEKFDKVIFMLDNDEPGRKAAVQCAEVLSPGKAYIATLPLKDANEMLQAKRGKEVLEAMWGARPHRPDHLLMGKELTQRILTYHLGDGATWHVNGLTEKTRGMHSELGEVITIVAATGAGKSTFCRELAAHILKTDHKLGYIALEEPPERMGIGIASVLLNRPLHFCKNEELPKDDIVRVLAPFEEKNQWIVYDSEGVISPAVLMSKIRYMVKGCGVTHIILDHLSIVASGLDVADDERRALDSVMTTISTMAQEMSVCIILVVHLKKPANGKAHEEGRQISLSDIRGSHGIAQLSHTVVALERDQQSDDDRDRSTVRVLKCRLTGDTGFAGELLYDKETGRLKETFTEFEDETQVEGADQAVPGVSEPVRPPSEDVSGVRPTQVEGSVEQPVAEHGDGAAKPPRKTRRKQQVTT